MNTLAELRDAAFGYDDHVVLRDVSTTIDAGDFMAIVGPNGAGKSTLVKGILGLVDFAAGEVDMFGVPASALKDRWRVGYVPQRQTAGGPIPTTVKELVSSGRLARQGLFGRNSARDRMAVEQAMERVGVHHLAHTPVHRLSGGQQRRVLIARALAGDAQLLVLDEPTAGVDVDAQAAVVEVLADLSADGVTVVVVTHDLEPFAQLLTRVLWVSRGRITYDGEPTQAIIAAASEPFSHHDHGDEQPRETMPDDLRPGG
ncbi:MAG TPA: metal ABC transporter ATP-binding protein [Actinomycetes bacterium]|nr:metal ABC transporter ATP-binding protein [Actinomycetes bacterium]